MKKKFFVPAKLVKGKDRWYILFYQVNPLTNELERFRETHNLNRIHDLRVRSRQAKEILEQINEALIHGYPFDDQNHSVVLMHTPILDALDKALEIKCSNLRKDSVRSYVSIVRIFKAWLKESKYDRLKIGECGRRIAQVFLDYRQIVGKIANSTHNINKKHLGELFDILIGREYLTENPWKLIKNKAEEEKLRRSLLEEERKIISGHIREKDPGLFLAIVLQYYCLLRPAELRRIRFSDIDLERGMISVPGTKGKNKKNQTISIPDPAIGLIDRTYIDKYPKNYLVFGPDFLPDPDEPCYDNAFNYYHHKYLQELVEMGKLTDTTGITFYSWKDTGITDVTDELTAFETMKHARHSDLKMTLKYYDMKRPVANVRNIKRSIL